MTKVMGKLGPLSTVPWISFKDQGLSPYWALICGLPVESLPI